MENYIRVKVAQGQFNVSGYRGKDRIRSAAFALSRSIGAHGTRPRRYMAAGAVVMFEEMFTGINRIVERFIARFNRG